MPESVPMSESAASAARTVSAVSTAGDPAASQVRGPGALTRWETVRAVMRLELLFTWGRRDTAALLGLCSLGALGVAVPGVRGWLGPFSPDKLVYYLLAAVLMVGLMLWLPSREARMRQLYGALPVTRLDVLAARYLLLAVGWVILFLGSSAAVLTVGVVSNDAVGWHLMCLFLFGMFVVVGPPLLAAYGGTTSLPVLAIWGMVICFMVGELAGIGAQVALSAMPQQVVLAGGLGLIAVLSTVGLGASWWGCHRIYLKRDH